jgi:predicted MFS family arabinose efflux permease
MMLIQRRAKAAGMEKPPGGVLGGLQIAGLATAALGLPIGGVLVETVGWRWVFFANVPVALIALGAALIWIPRDPASQERKNLTDVLSSIDVIGIVGFGLAMIALLLFLFSLQDANWAMLATAALLFAALTFWELRAKSPFLDVRLLVRNSALTRTYFRYALVALCVYLVMYGITQWMEAARGISALSAGVLLLPMSIISGIVVFPISRRNLVRGPVIIAAIASLAGSAGVLLLTSSSSIIWIVVITVVFGVVLGTASSGNQLALYTQAPPEQLGVASGLFRTFGYIGSIASSAITGIVFRTSATDSGVHIIGFIMVGVSLAAIAFTLFDRTLCTPTRTEAPA